jgi:hypothetical protein
MKKDRQKQSLLPVAQDAIDLLSTDHKKVCKLFKDYKKLDDADEDKKAKLVANICLELLVHTKIEEEIFYPAVRTAIDDEDLLDEALIEHANAMDLIEQLQEMGADDELYDARVIVLGEEIEHHIEEEEEEMFSQVKRARLDTKRLGEKLQQRKQALMTELGAQMT